MAKITLNEEITELEREYRKREEVYPKQMFNGKLTQEEYDYRQGCWMEITKVMKALSLNTKIGKLKYSPKQLIAELNRELKIRQRIYPSLVKTYVLDQITADYRVACVQQTKGRIELMYPSPEAIQQNLF
jgi:hypothetical protein